MNKLKGACEEIGMKINKGKQKFMTNLVPSSNIDIDGYEVERVEDYIYLIYEVLFSRDNQTTDLKRRLTLT